MKRLLAFGACATVAALLVMRILPELTDGVAEEMKTDITQKQIELSITTAVPEAIPETPSEASSVARSSSVASLLLPPPPAIPQVPPAAPQPQSPPQSPVAEIAPAPEKEIAPPPEPEVSPLPTEPEVALQSFEPEPELKPEKSAQADISPTPELVTAPTPPEPVSEMADLLLVKLQKVRPETQLPVQPEPVVETMDEDHPVILIEEQERPDRFAPSSGQEDRPASFEVAVAEAEAFLSVPLPTSKPTPQKARPLLSSRLSATSDGTRALSNPLEDKARQPAEIVAPNPAAEAEGRVLLRILEHGSGPEIEIAWPVSAIQRRALYRLFEACYGMEIAMIDSAGRLFGRSGKSGQAWQPNMDRYSGFVRQPAGRLTRDEKARLAHIRALHGGLRNASHVRLFPRRLDALLLGGLKALVGEGYSRANAIRAHYRRVGDIVLVESIRLDGRPILGRIDLSAASRRCRSGAWS